MRKRKFILIKKYEEVNKILNISPSRTIEFFNNLVSGIIGGSIIYLLTFPIPNQTNFLNQINLWTWKVFFCSSFNYYRYKNNREFNEKFSDFQKKTS
jgi:hypothetical protein